MFPGARELEKLMVVLHGFIKELILSKLRTGNLPQEGRLVLRGGNQVEALKRAALLDDGGRVALAFILILKKKGLIREVIVPRISREKGIRVRVGILLALKGETR
jgi:hypothetical protein